jgi:hypothetical protein
MVAQNLHRKDAKSAKKDKNKREDAIFYNKSCISSFFFSSLRSLRLCGANFLNLATLSRGRGNTSPPQVVFRFNGVPCNRYAPV